MAEYNADTALSTYQKDLNTCLNNRQNAYMEELGNWQDQLDMIYKDFDGWKAKVLEIKNRYPKPTE